MKRGEHLIDKDFLKSEKADNLLDQIREEDWIPTHPDGPYAGDSWRVIKLIDNHEKTKDFSKYKGLQELVDKFKCPIFALVFYSILPGGELHPHRDLSGTLELGRLRYHIPIKTNKDVSFFISNKEVHMAKGELWALNTSYLHAVSNHSDSERIHIVFIVDVNDWAWATIPKRGLMYYSHSLYFFFLVFWVAVKSFLLEPSKIKPRLKIAKFMLQRIFQKIMGKGFK